MPSLYVTEPGSTVRLSGESLVVTAEIDPDGKGPEPARREELFEVEPHRLELIALVGRCNITTDAMHLCLERGIAVAWFSRNGKYLGRVSPQMARSADIRLRQYAIATEAAQRLARAREVVAAKLANASEVIEGLRSNLPGNRRMADALQELGQYRAKARGSATIEHLLGTEGIASRAYFGAFGEGFKGGIGFPGRTKHPPTDPANALLSFGYVLLCNLIAGALEARGLDPAIGFYHELRPGRPSLALDLLEELRHPSVDRFVLRICNLGILKPEHFELDDSESLPGENGIRLTRDGLKVFFREWEKHLATPVRDKETGGAISVAEILRRQVDRLAASLRGTEVYKSFLFGD